MKTNPKTAAFPFVTITLDKQKLRDTLDGMRKALVRYRMGAKVPRHGAKPGVDYQALDCSGCVDELLWSASNGAVDLPEGSWYEQEAIEKAGFKQTYINAGRLKDGIVRIAFLPKSRANNDRHVVLILDGQTLESSGGVGPSRRTWDPNQSNWMGRCDVYVLTAPKA